MQRIESLEDERKGVVTYALSDGRRVQLDLRAVQTYGAARLLKDAGLDPGPAVPLSVYQDGHHVGWMQSDFDPLTTRSQSVFYDIRPADFRRDGDRWIADSSLGMGDLEAISLFRRKDKENG